MILADTNVLVAAADSSDTNHERCARWLVDADQSLGLPATVLAESCYLLDRFGGPGVEARFSDFASIFRRAGEFGFGIEAKGERSHYEEDGWPACRTNGTARRDRCGQ